VKGPKTGPEVQHDADPYRRFANSCIKDKPSKKDLVEKIEQFIQAEEAKL
jgi:Lon protease-like protein